MTEENQTPAAEVEVPAGDTGTDTLSSTPAVESAPVADPKAALLDAISAGVESAPARGPKEPADESAGKVEGEEGSGAGKEKDKDGAEDAAKAAAGDAEKKDEKKDPDHVNDPVPAEWSERARERITHLASAVKERDAQLETQGNLINAVMSTGASPEQFGGIITFLRDFNGNDPAALVRRQEALQTMMEGVALRMGKPLPGVDFLSKHDDLKSAVHYGQITEAHAQEIAIAREARTRAGAQQTATAAEAKAKQEADAAMATERQAAITELNTLGAELAKVDPQYDAKFATFRDAIMEKIKTVRPSQWKALFLESYAMARAPAAAEAPGLAPAMVRDPTTGQFVKPNKGQPIRPVAPSGTGGGVKAAPKSLREAIDFSLAGRGE